MNSAWRSEPFRKATCCPPAKGGTGWKLTVPAPSPPAPKLPEEFPHVQKSKQAGCAYIKARAMGFLLLPLSACVILNTWLLSPVPFPPNAHLVNVSSCLRALTLHVPKSSMSASPGQLDGHVASQNMVNISSLCCTFPLFWGKRETREAGLQVLTFGELLNFSFIFSQIRSPKIRY